MSIHKPVLLEESLEKLNLKKGDTVVDATLGGGGHSRRILKIIGDKGRLIAIDKDEEAIENFIKFPISNFQFPNNFQFPISKIKNNYFVHSNFADLGNILKTLKIERVDAILADFGMSSDQLEGAERGFSFQKDAELDMRMNQDGPASPKLQRGEQKTAREIVNFYNQDDLEKILYEFGEERYARKIAKAIVTRRKIKPIEKTLELVEIISNAVPGKYRRRKKHFAAKTFQALRMEVNNELENIKCFLPQAIDILKTGGRLAVISFHSGEDRIVKNLFKENARGCICPPEFPVCHCGRKPKIKIITKKPIVPSSEEVERNSRSRSAKLRVAEKL